MSHRDWTAKMGSSSPYRVMGAAAVAVVMLFALGSQAWPQEGRPILETLQGQHEEALAARAKAQAAKQKAQAAMASAEQALAAAREENKPDIERRAQALIQRNQKIRAEADRQLQELGEWLIQIQNLQRRFAEVAKTEAALRQQVATAPPPAAVPMPFEWVTDPFKDHGETILAMADLGIAAGDALGWLSRWGVVTKAVPAGWAARGVMIFGKGLLKGLDGAEVYLTQKTELYERALEYLKKDPKLFADTLRALKSGIDPKVLPHPEVVEAAKALLDPNSFSSRHLLLEATTSKEAIKGFLTGMVIEGASILIGKKFGEMVSPKLSRHLKDLEQTSHLMKEFEFAMGRARRTAEKKAWEALIQRTEKSYRDKLSIVGWEVLYEAFTATAVKGTVERAVEGEGKRDKQ